MSSAQAAQEGELEALRNQHRVQPPEYLIRGLPLRLDLEYNAAPGHEDEDEDGDEDEAERAFQKPRGRGRGRGGRPRPRRRRRQG